MMHTFSGMPHKEQHTVSMYREGVSAHMTFEPNPPSSSMTSKVLAELQAKWLLVSCGVNPPSFVGTTTVSLSRDCRRHRPEPAAAPHTPPLQSPPPEQPRKSAPFCDHEPGYHVRVHEVNEKQNFGLCTTKKSTVI